MKLEPSTIVIGIGNEYRGDDAAGILVARRLESVGPDWCKIVEHDGEGIDLIHAWDGYRRVIVIDAVLSDDQVGTIHRLHVTSDTLQLAEYRCSSHHFALPDAVRLAATLSLLPDSLVVYGIAGANYGFGDARSPAVVDAIETTTHLVATDLNSAMRSDDRLEIR